MDDVLPLSAYSRQVLGGLPGMTDADLDDLESAGVITRRESAGKHEPC